MNIFEGSRRMRLAGRWLTFIPLIAFLVLIGLGEVISLFRGNPRPMLGLIPISLPFLFSGVLLWLGGWIIEGFAKESH